MGTRPLLALNMNKRKTSINIPSIVYLEQPKFLHYHLGAEFLAFIPKKTAACKLYPRSHIKNH